MAEKPEIVDDKGAENPQNRALLKCPNCGILGVIDQDQFEGKVSIECPKKGCDYHETVDFRE